MLKQTLLVATIAFSVATSAAHAGDHYFYTCAGYRSIPAEAVEDDPVVATSIHVYYPLHKEQPVGFDVEHKTLGGSVHQRADQYRVTRVGVNRSGEFWFGALIKNPNVTVIGQLTSRNHYVEKIYTHGKLERTITSTCVVGEP